MGPLHGVQMLLRLSGPPGSLRQIFEAPCIQTAFRIGTGERLERVGPGVLAQCLYPSLRQFVNDLSHVAMLHPSSALYVSAGAISGWWIRYGPES